MPTVTASTPPEPIWVADDAALAAAIEVLLRAERYALDTEFQGERSYYPTLALLQISDGTQIWLVDPLACDVRLVAPLLDGPGTMLAHAARQDLEILQREVGTGPARLVDTQIAAAFAGAGNQSLLTLCKRHLGVTLEKGDRLTDWTARPLRESARRYAALDVAHLHALADGTDLAAEKLSRVLLTDPGMGVIRHADAGYDHAIATAAQRGVRLPMRES